MTAPHIHRPSRALRRRRVRSDNLVVMPASLLPFKKEWQRIANSLPQGGTLLVVPDKEVPVRRSMRRVAAHLYARGRRVASIEARQFS